MPSNLATIGKVVAGGYCVGCGICAHASGHRITMEFDAIGRLQVANPTTLSPAEDADLAQICPMSGAGANEDQIGAECFPDAPHDASIGRHLASFAGFAAEGDFRERGSSGGMISWTLAELLKQGLIDAVLHVVPTTRTEHPYFAFSISRSSAEIQRGSKSRYYPVQLAEGLTHLREQPGRYAVVGLPCFIKGVRLLARRDPVIRERVKFCLSLVCGHLKTTRFADQIALQSGVNPTAVRSIDFRHKLPDRPAYEYAARLDHGDATTQRQTVKPVTEMFGRDWGLGLFQYEACDFCDDVVGETADMSFGDAWLPKYGRDSKGTNVVVVRNPKLLELVGAARKEGRLQLDDLPPSEVARSQAGGLRHRRDGLAYRLHLKDLEGVWRPAKRVTAGQNHLTRQRRRVYRLRQEISRRSHVDYQESMGTDGIQGFIRRMRPLIETYERARQEPLLSRLKLRFTRLVNRALGRGPKKAR